MPSTRPAGAVRRRRRSAALVALAVVGATTMGALGHLAQASSPSSAEQAAIPSAPPGALRPADGSIPHDAAAVEDEIAAADDLDAALSEALRRATSAAAVDGVTIQVTSGRRSPAHQQRLLDEAIAEHGSMEEAVRWVATPATSAHVSGDAVDVGGDRAIRWLSDRGHRYGLCQIYANEPWHFELRPAAADHGCPAMYPDPTHDPRMR
jgi:D-alanyl-D-alanine carboxypeptidase